MSLFLQMHTLTPYAATLLNRDDVGQAKRLPFGGKPRVRVSSQCLKRHWREAPGAWSMAGLGQPMSVRSRKTFAREIAAPLVEEGHDPAAVVAVLLPLRAAFLGESKKAKAEKTGKKGGDATAVDLDKELGTEQIIVLGRPEIDYLIDLARECLKAGGDPAAAAEARLKGDKQLRANLQGLKLASGLDAALFGRMVTSDILARGDGAVHVAHSFTVHAEEAEPDYFTAVDDLTREEGELGAGLIQTSELTSGLFYGYVVVDVPQLVDNLGRDAELAAGVVERLIHLIATTSPGAKRGSTAPYGYADLVLLEAGERQPRSLAGAFHKPVPLEDARAKAGRRIAEHLDRFDRMYGPGEERRVATMLDLDGDMGLTPSSLGELASWAAARVREGSA